MKNIFVIIIVCFCLSITQAQTAPKPIDIPVAETQTNSVKNNEHADLITPAEAKEAKELAAKFVERMKGTRDISPLIDEMFVANFKEQIVKDDQFCAFMMMPKTSPKILIRRKAQTLQRYFQHWL